jgi:hypothetical protein
MSKRIDFLIQDVRRETENEEVSETTGISDEEIIRFLNDAQERLQSLIVAAHPKAFTKEVVIDTVVKQTRYELPRDAFLNNKVSNVEYSDSGQDEEFYPLEPIILKRRAVYEGVPSAYYRKAGAIYLNPLPQRSGAKLRINYCKRLDRLDKRRARVELYTEGAGNTITELRLETSGNLPIDSASLAEHDYICVVDRRGVPKMRNLPVDAIDTASGVVTLASGFTFNDGETIDAGDFIVGGEDTTTHIESTEIELPRNVERYLIAYASWKMLKRDSSVDYQEQQQELDVMEADIVNSYGDITDDITLIPTLNDWYYWSE